MIVELDWNRYDFDLKTGHSDTGLKACTYALDVRTEDEGEVVYVEAPEGGTNWRLVELRPVSEGMARLLLLSWTSTYSAIIAFADPPPPPLDLSHLSLSSEKPVDAPPEPIVPLDNPPKTLIEWAVLILNTADPTLKV